MGVEQAGFTWRSVTSACSVSFPQLEPGVDRWPLNVDPPEIRQALRQGLYQGQGRAARAVLQVAVGVVLAVLHGTVPVGTAPVGTAPVGVVLGVMVRERHPDLVARLAIGGARVEARPRALGMAMAHRVSFRPPSLSSGSTRVSSRDRAAVVVPIGARAAPPPAPLPRRAPHAHEVPRRPM